jgi:hypothetical protein
MGYACPVCGDPQADAGHLANHLAFTAMIRDDGHEAWLDEHAAGWSEWGEADLADHLDGHDAVESADYPQVFEDTTGDTDHEDPASERSGALFDEGGHGHSHDHAGHDHASHTGHAGEHTGHAAGQSVPGLDVEIDPASDDLSEKERSEIIAEARELTREMYDEGDEGEAESDTAAEDGDETDTAAEADADAEGE